MACNSNGAAGKRFKTIEKPWNFILFGVITVLSRGFWQSEGFMQLAAGVALFMFGMLALERGFQAFTGGVPESVLATAARTGEGLITPDMASSLMNDSALARGLHKRSVCASRTITALVRDNPITDGSELTEEEGLSLEPWREIDALLVCNRKEIEARLRQYGRPD